jgi:hypothetical protein
MRRSANPASALSMTVRTSPKASQVLPSWACADTVEDGAGSAGEGSDTHPVSAKPITHAPAVDHFPLVRTFRDMAAY